MNISDGLASAEVYKAGQDSKGNMWFCTSSGVTRFDGYFFKTYTVEDGLADNTIFDFHEDGKGRIWFLSYNSMLSYLEEGEIVQYKYNDSIKKMIGEVVISEKQLFVDQSGTLYYSLRKKGLMKIDTTGNWEQLHNVHNDTNQVVLHRFGSRLMLSFLYDPINYSPTGYELIDRSSPGKEKRIFFSRETGRLGLTQSKGGKDAYLLIEDKVLNVSTEKIVYNGPQKGILRVAVDENGGVWLGTLNGLKSGVINSNGLLEIKNEYLEGQAVSDVFWDREGGCWITTLDHGVYYANNFAIDYLDERDGLFSPHIVSIAVHNKQVWVSLNNGWKNVDNGDEKIYKSTSYSKVAGNGIDLLISNSELSAVRRTDRYVEVPFMSDMYCANGKIYAASTRGFVFNPGRDELDTIYDNLKDQSPLRQTNFTAIAADNNGDVFLGTINGLFALEPNGQLSYCPDKHKAREMMVTDILYSGDLGLVVGTSNQGIIIINDGKITRRIRKADGLKSNNVRSLAQAADGTLLIGLNVGLAFIKNGEIGFLGENQGLTSPEVSALHVDDEHLYVGTMDGLYRVRFDLLKDVRKHINPSIDLDSVVLDGKHININELELVIPDGSNILRILFSIKSFRNWHNKLYQYRISGDKDWITLTSPEIIIVKPKGEIDLEVRYMDEFDNWSNVTKLKRIQIILPLWKQWYFWLISTLGISVLIMFWYRKRQQKVEAILRMENEMLSLEQRMQNARLNPHFVFNVLNSIKSSLILKRPEIAEDYLNKFSGLMRDVLKSAGENKISIEQEIDIITKYIELEQVRYNGAFDFEINASEEVKKLSIPSMIVQPFVENAIIHGVSHNIHIRGKIIIEFSKFDENVIDINITDNGEQSFNDENPLLKNNTANAIAITRSRLRNYNKLLHTDVYGLKMERNDSDTPTTIVNIRVPGLS